MGVQSHWTPSMLGGEDPTKTWQKEKMIADGMVEVGGCWMTEEEAANLRKYLEKRKDE